jgi:HemY protein
MRKAVATLLFLAALVALALWLASLGGAVELRIGAYTVELAFPVALLLVTTLFGLGWLALAGWGALRRWPARRAARRADQRRAAGDRAQTKALLALAAGNAEAARLELRRARALLGDTPNLLLLNAEAERLAGSEEGATAVFEALLLKPEARFLGLRGLLRQAMQRQDWKAAQALAREAEEAMPGAAWLREERARLAVRTSNWREAVALAPPDASRAALALAAAQQEPDQAKAMELERSAFEADPAFAPAALAYAARLRAMGSPRRSRAVLDRAWAAGPHPDLAAAMLAEEQELLLRVSLAEEFVRANPTHDESRFLLARVALAAGLTGRARGELEALLREGKPTRRVYLLLAALEEAEQGETAAGKARQMGWLREAAHAQPDRSWRCDRCGAGAEAWQPVCAVCGAAGTASWA